jgi:hypothetical protein
MWVELADILKTPLVEILNKWLGYGLEGKSLMCSKCMLCCCYVDFMENEK